MERVLLAERRLGVSLTSACGEEEIMQEGCLGLGEELDFIISARPRVIVTSSYNPALWRWGYRG